ncbi:MAG TPA: hypothetical protein VGH74_01230 [Planctomycetaceae bacterium]|jgi:hypothetical protein
MSFAPRVWSPDSSGPGSLSLREAYEQYYAPELDAPERDGTRKAFRNMLAHWEARSENPRLEKISADDWKELQRRLRKDGYPKSTVAKVGRHLRALLRRLGPATDRNPEGLGVLSVAPYIKIPKVPRTVPQNVDTQSIDKLYAACDVARWPRIRDVLPSDFWRGLICAVYNLGPRTREIVHDGRDPTLGWLWRNYRPDNLRSGDLLSDGSGRPVCSIRFFRDKMDDELLLPVNSILQAHLALIRTDRKAIFPVTKNDKSFYDQWRLIKTKAGLYVAGSDFPSFQGLRRTCQSRWDRINPKFGDWILGHKRQDVAGRFYENFSQDVADVCESLPQPEAFQAVFARRPRAGQRYLFE